MDWPAVTAFEGTDWGVDGTVRFCVVGLGHFARETVLPVLERAENCEATVVVSGGREKAERVAADHDATGLTYDEYGAGGAADAYDAVYICTPNALHLPHAETAAELGKDVVTEKPMEATVDRAEEMRDACEAAGVRLLVAYRMHAEPATRVFRELVADGFVGDPVHLSGAFGFPMGPNGWRVDPELAGGAALMDVGIYPLNTARYVLDAEPVAVDAVTAAPHEGFDCADEHVSFRCEFPEGVTLDGRASFNSHGQNFFEVVGTDGTLRLEPAFAVGVDRTVTVERDGKVTTFDGVGGDEVYEEFEWFGRALLEGEAVSADGAEGLQDMRIMAAIYEAADHGTTVDVP